MSSYWQSMAEGGELHAVDATIYIGGVEARGFVEEHGITAVVSCMNDLEHARLKRLYPLPEDVAEHCVEMDDTTQFEHDALHALVEGAVAFIEAQVSAGRRVLVHCAAGVSRSATVVIAYLMQRDLEGFAETLTHVRDVRPFVRPNARFAEYLQWREANVVGPDRSVDWQEDPRYAPALDCPLHEVDAQLFIGGVLGRLRVAQHGITLVVACLNTMEQDRAPLLPEGVAEHVAPINDVEHFPRDTLHIIVSTAVAEIEAAVARGERVLVHCYAGVSRSATVVLAYLMKRDGLSFLAAMAKLEAVRYCVCPNRAFQQYLLWREQHA